ncbi:putative O-linked N-acetylglucosamine transferase (SPINDLY family) [Azospirillum agricola]|uniref:O-linked N-acetylglucosamine transferase, SPINDLY family protein n=1 Tax=Azospirillum agricola TaxID=1720247 RepID=UPI001AE4A8B4|nr:tetratricopeptide repeat protein [Azospirillum agricola]MBP2233266.1 putative O-linked N-acetylglucosamine transferase (SPINDLY family) [Azospirillum agricola]
MTITLQDAAGHAVLCYEQGRFEEAGQICRAVLEDRPDHSGFLEFLATIRTAQGMPEAAIALYRRSIALTPLRMAAWWNLATALERHHRLDRAHEALKRAVAIAPDHPQAYCNLGALHRAGGRRPLACRDFSRAVVLNPQDAAPRTSLGLTARENSEVSRSVAILRKAVICDPAAAETYLQLAHGLREQSEFLPAATAYGRARRLDPGSSTIQGYQFLLKQALCDWTGYEALCRTVLDTIDHATGIAIPLGILAIGTTAAQQRRAAGFFYDRMVSPLARAPARPVPAAPRGDRPLRVAYLSADFHEHATAYLAAELFERHDRDRVTPLAYSYGTNDGSPMRRRLEAAFTQFCDVQAAGAETVARRMAEDGVDILVDLKGYTKQARFDLLARRLAPVQVAYLGYPGTSGCPHMDYILGDPLVTPPEHQEHYSERLVLLPDSYQVNDRRRPLPDRTPSRAECGLPEDSFVFCSFNAPYKITPALFGLWMRLLKRVPGSVLWLYGGVPAAIGNLRREAAAHGVAPNRLVFAAKAPLAEHLARYRVADLCLDTLPYNGHTTTSDALWIGCPVVTCLGETFASRVAASLLGAAGLPGLAAATLEGYEALAADLAGDVLRLARLRRHLEDARWQSPLFDSGRFTRHVELAYETMWRLHEAGQEPRSFALQSSAVS